MTQVLSLGLFGIDGFPVKVEACVSPGLPAFEIVGLPDNAVRESRERVRAAIKSCGADFPARRITVNLAPGDVRKEGPIYDLPILIALLCTAGLVPEKSLDGAAFAGELALNGDLRPMRGALAMAAAAHSNGIKRLYLPLENAPEAAVIDGVEAVGAPDAATLIAHLRGEEELFPAAPDESPDEPIPLGVDFAEVRGQEGAKRAMEIAAAGFHNLLMIGSPGAGKSMLAKRLPTILPPLTREKMIESTKIYSVAGRLAAGRLLVTQPPFRSPHHTVSSVGLSGGGRIPSPGEISLAHNGVLFLDELPEFDNNALEVLRQPIEDGRVTISRASGTLTFPSSFMLVCAMNPCKCGYFGHPTRRCTCTPASISQYMAHVSGPLLDRIDIHIEIPPVSFSDLSGIKRGPSSAEMRARVVAARERQRERYGDGGMTNSRLSPADMEKYCILGPSEKELLRTAFEKLGMSARAYDRIVKLSRTIADIEGSDEIKRDHVLEALQYRSLDRKYWSR